MRRFAAFIYIKQKVTTIKAPLEEINYEKQLQMTKLILKLKSMQPYKILVR